MTAKEIFKKVEAYNKMAKELGKADRVAVNFADSNIVQIRQCATWKEFKKALNETFVPLYVDMVMRHDDFEFNKATEGQWGWYYDQMYNAVMEFEIV